MKMKKENLTSRDLQAMETRRKIFNTAAQLITEKGFDNVTVEEICKQSGVAKGLFYHYFNSKADIVIETYMDVSPFHI
jgi:TetR/AcrR family fatty acid metabolism transcriptional regulator